MTKKGADKSLLALAIAVGACGGAAVTYGIMSALISKGKKKDARAPHIIVSDEVKKALAKNLPVVALESTIITHGMPYPSNVQTALEVEDVIRKNGAIPATIGFIDGVPHVGLTEEQLSQLGETSTSKPMKVSTRDFGYVMSNHRNGGTTVAATMHIASLVGIKVFATGGIGGVHRNSSETHDVSADISAFVDTPVTVVCAGPKAILDIPATVEYFETYGIPIIGYRTEEMPSFYCRTCQPSIPLDQHTSTPSELAQLIIKHNEMLPHRGALVVNPIPAEDSMESHEIDEVVAKALEEADEKHIHGKDITPFLLAKICELTGSRSLTANIALIKNNAAVAAQLAVSLAHPCEHVPCTESTKSSEH